MIARTNYFPGELRRVAGTSRHLATTPNGSGGFCGSIPNMNGGTAVLEPGLKHRILRTREMAKAVGGSDTEWVSTQCREGKIPGAFRLGENGAWRIHSEDFREWLISEGISTKVLDSLLE